MKCLLGVVLLLIGLFPSAALSAESGNWEVGLRGGMEATGSDEHYQIGELYLLRDLPWQVDTMTGTLLARLDLGAGYLEGAGDDGGGLLSAGVDLVWIPWRGPIEIEAGFRPSWLTDHLYGDDDYGGDLQFQSHVGIAARYSRFVIGYRYLHMSNAAIYCNNDGLNLHLFGVGIRF